MPEGEPPADDRDEPGLLGRVEREGARGEGRDRALDHRRALGVVGGRGEQRQPRRRGQPRDALVEHALEPAGHRQRLRQRLVARELGGAERGRQLDERERVAVGLLEQPLAHLRRRRRGRVREQLRSRRIVEAVDVMRRHVGRLEHADVALARGEQEHDALRVEPARDELQRVRGAGVEPVRVVDQAQHRPLLGKLGQQRQTGGVDEEALLPAAVREPERGPQRGGLGRGQAVDQAAARGAAAAGAPRTAARTPIPPRARSSTCMSLARARASSSRTVFPTPASPRSASAPLRESRAASSSAPMRARSASLPNSTGRPYLRGWRRSRRFTRCDPRGAPAGLALPPFPSHQEPLRCQPTPSHTPGAGRRSASCPSPCSSSGSTTRSSTLLSRACRRSSTPHPRRCSGSSTRTCSCSPACC